MTDETTTLPRHPGIYGSVVGQLGRHDIQVLADLARRSSRILEFGCGGSTLAFAQFASNAASIVSVDTDAEWIARTREKLCRVGIEESIACAHDIRLLDLDTWIATARASHAWYDLVFVDGLESRRAEFAEHAWPMLQPGGEMVWHDGRWPQIVAMVLNHVARHYQEVDSLQIGVLRSNMIVMRKKVELPELNDPDRGRTEAWMSATAELPKEWPFR